MNEPIVVDHSNDHEYVRVCGAEDCEMYMEEQPVDIAQLMDEQAWTCQGCCRRYSERTNTEGS